MYRIKALYSKYTNKAKMWLLTRKTVLRWFKLCFHEYHDTGELNNPYNSKDKTYLCVCKRCNDEKTFTKRDINIEYAKYTSAKRRGNVESLEYIVIPRTVKWNIFNGNGGRK